MAKPNYDAQYAVSSKYLKVEEDATAVTALAKITAGASAGLTDRLPCLTTLPA